MRILFLGPVHREKVFFKQKGNYPFLKGQGQNSWTEALAELGHQVFVFRYTDSILITNLIRVYVKDFLEKLSPAWYGRLRRFREKYYFLSSENYFKNLKLKKRAENAKPNLIIISGGITSIFPKTIKKIKDAYHCKVLLFSGVNPYTSATMVELKMIKEGIIDIVVENDRGYAELWKKSGAKKVIVLPISSVDPKLHRKVELTDKEQDEYGCDVCFVGSLTRERQEILKKIVAFFNPYSNRHSGLSRISQNGWDSGVAPLPRMTVKIWGDILPTIGLHKELKPYYQGVAYGEKMVKIFNAAKVVLNFQPKDMTYGGNMRTFEIPGCGAFQLADKIDKEWFEEGKEYIGFKDKKDLQRKIRYYLKYDDERKKIAEAGYKRAYREHTYKERFQKLFKLINETS